MLASAMMVNKWVTVEVSANISPWQSAASSGAALSKTGETQKLHAANKKKKKKPEKPVCQNHTRRDLLVYIAKVSRHIQSPDSTRVRFRKATAATAYNCGNLEQPHVHDEGWS